MSDRTSIERRSIVIVGQMNPAIHSERWLREVGLLGDQDVVTRGSWGVDESSAVVNRNFEILCLRERWQCVWDPEQNASVELGPVGFVGKLFTVLTHTPVDAIGYNVHVHFKAPALEERLAGIVAGLGMPRSGQAVLRTVDDDASPRLMMQLEHSQKEGFDAFMLINQHYNIIDLINGQFRFELGPLIESTYDDAMDRAREIISRVIASLS